MTPHSSLPTPHSLKALVVAPAWIGDTVMAQALFGRLHEHTPGLQLDALAPRWVAPVLQRMPEIGQIIDNPFIHGELSLTARYRLARQVAQAGYQRAYILPNSLKSALIPFFAGIPERIGFTGEARYALINRRHTLDPIALPQMADRFAQLAEPVGAPLPRPLPLAAPGLQQRATGRDARSHSASSARRKWRFSAPVPNTARPSAGRHVISPPWPINWPGAVTPSGCSARRKTRRSATTSSAWPQRPLRQSTSAAAPR